MFNCCEGSSRLHKNRSEARGTGRKHSLAAVHDAAESYVNNQGQRRPGYRLSESLNR